MANTISTVMTYSLDGSTVDFAIPFEYLARKFVKVTLVGTNRQELVLNQDYRFTTRTQITTTRAWGTGDGYELIEIRRYTSATDRLVDFADGSILRAYDLNISQVQTLHVAEEARDLTADTIGVNNDGNLDARGRRIVNVADGTDAGDVVTVRQQQSWAESALSQANRAKTEADRAKTEADRATAQATISSSAATAAGISEGKAKTSEDNAKASEVAAGMSSSNASASATAAGISEGKAKTSEDNAKASEERAILEADRAQTANPDNQLKKVNNLSDVADKATSRANLDVYSKKESEVAGELVLTWTEAIAQGWMSVNPSLDVNNLPTNLMIIRGNIMYLIGRIIQSNTANKISFPTVAWCTILKGPRGMTKVSTACEPIGLGDLYTSGTPNQGIVTGFTTPRIKQGLPFYPVYNSGRDTTTTLATYLIINTTLVFSA